MSPTVENRSGQVVILNLISDGGSREYSVENNASLLLTNLVDDEDLRKLIISSEGETSIELTLSDIVGYLKDDNRVFIIQEGLTMVPDSRSS